MKVKRVAWRVIAILASVSIAFLAGVAIGQEKKTDATVYELRTYTTVPGRLPALQKLFAEHTMRFFEKHGMRNGLHWIPIDEARKDNTLIYFLVHESQEAADRSWKAFQADPEWIKAREATLADGKLLEKAERVFMRLADFSPARPMR